MNIFERRNIEADLRAFLPGLLSGEYECLEYSDPRPGQKWTCALRIRYINTAGGPQFQVRSVNSLGEEHTSQYCPDIEETMIQAMSRIEHYHKPTPLQQKLLELKRKNDGFIEPKMCIHPVTNQSTESPLTEYRKQSLDEWTDKLGATTVNL